MSENSDKIAHRPSPNAQRPTPNAQRPTPNGNSCPKFSVIVPAYNTEAYIARCLDSLVNQDIPERNYEILITDDGSTDKTGAICDTYAAKYPFIHVTHTSNHGVSHARNTALEKCRGEYVMFCDSDDFVSPQMFSVMTRAVEVFGEPDMMIYGLAGELPGGKWPVYDAGAMSEADGRFCTAEEVCMNIFTDRKTRGYSHNKAMKRELALSARYDEELYLFEDEHYFMSVLTRNMNARVCYLDYRLYCYFQHQGPRLLAHMSRIRTDEDLPPDIKASEKMLALPGLPPAVAQEIEGRNYMIAAQCVFSNPVPINPGAYARLREYLRKFAGTYYFRNKGSSSYVKFKTLVKHILILLGIRKPRRK